MRRASMVAAAGGDIHPPAGDITLGKVLAHKRFQKPLYRRSLPPSKCGVGE